MRSDTLGCRYSRYFNLPRPGIAVVSLCVVVGCASEPSPRTQLTGPAATFSRLIDERGAMTYLARPYPHGASESDALAKGLLVMRDPADLRPLGRSYYDDGYGNLIRFGSFTAPSLGGKSRYALTFLKGGGTQLAFDFRNDAVVDVLLNIDRDGRMGALADPDLQRLLECLEQQRAEGADILAAAGHCVAQMGGGGGTGGPGASTSNDIQRLAEPDCSSPDLGVPGSVANTPKRHESTTIIDLDNGDRIKATEVQNENGTTTTHIEIRDKQGRLVYRETTVQDRSGQETSSEVETTEYHTTGGWTTSYRRTEKGKVVESRETRYEVEIGPAVIEQYGPPGASRQPVPDCDDCPVEDPRCAPAPNDIAGVWECMAETGLGMDECLRRTRDAIYTATGGRCSTGPGADDRPTVVCRDRALAECIESGRRIDECLREFGIGAGVDEGGPGDDDFLQDRFGRSRGQVGFYIDATPLGAVFAGFCPRGVEQICPGGGRF